MNSDMILGSSLGLDVIVTLAGTAGHLDSHDPHGGIFLGHQHGRRWQSRLQATTGPSEVLGATDINTDLHCCVRATAHDTAFGSSPCSAITMDLGSKQAIHVSPFLTTLTP